MRYGSAVIPKARLGTPFHARADAANATRAWAERAFDLRRWTPMPRGGHFAALEAPGLLAGDVRAVFRPLRGG